MFQRSKITRLLLLGLFLIINLNNELVAQEGLVNSNRIGDDQGTLINPSTAESCTVVRDTEDFLISIGFQNDLSSIQILNQSSQSSASAIAISFTFETPTTAGESILKETGATLTSDSYYLTYRVAPQGSSSQISAKLNPARDFEAYDIELETIALNASIDPNNTVPTLSNTKIRLSTTNQSWLTNMDWLSSGDSKDDGVEFRFNIIKTDKSNFSDLFGALNANGQSPDIGDVVFTISD